MRDPYFGPIVPVRTQLRIAPWFILVVVTLALLEDRGLINLTGQTQSVIQQHQPGVSASATADIPPGYLAAYRRAAGTCPHLRWSLLAGVGKVESDHGRNNTTSPAGAQGPMQFMPGTWAAYGRGGNVWDPRDAIPAAARKLCNDGVHAGRVRQALYAYNCGRPYCAVSVGYVRDVLAIARRYQRRG